MVSRRLTAQPAERLHDLIEMARHGRSSGGVQLTPSGRHAGRDNQLLGDKLFRSALPPPHRTRAHGGGRAIRPAACWVGHDPRPKEPRQDHRRAAAAPAHPRSVFAPAPHRRECLRRGRAALAYLRELQRHHAVAVLVIHHAKNGAGRARAGQALRGSSEFHARETPTSACAAMR